MASIGQIIFGSMICLIVVISGLIIFILAIAFSVSQGTVTSSSPSTVGILENDVILDCRFISKSSNLQLSDVSITWQKDALSGVVYQYKNKAAQLQGQNIQFKNRAQLFQDAIATGNASLLLKNVRQEDEGVYRCTVNAGKVSGTANVNLRVAAFSAPTFTLQNGSLHAVAQKWFPQPKVSWSNQNGEDLNSSPSFIQNSAGIFQVSSFLKDPMENNTYTCLIQNDLVKAVSEVTVKANNVMEKTQLIFNAASTKTASLQLLLTLILIFSALQ